MGREPINSEKAKNVSIIPADFQLVLVSSQFWNIYSGDFVSFYAVCLQLLNCKTEIFSCCAIECTYPCKFLIIVENLQK